jgi:branched-subunit amino acid aminotransferase/4-amino-4-deoxychorismate lyase
MAELNGLPANLDEIQALALYNYGHFTSMRVEDQQVRGLSLHLDRLVRDCRALFDADLDPDRVRHLVRNALGDADGPVVVRVTVFDPNLDLGHAGGKAHPHVLVTTRSAAQLPSPPMRVRPARYYRELPAVKHAGLFGTMRERRAAQIAGFDDVLFIDTESNISEGATWNIGFFDGAQVIWPQADCLVGVTMQLLERVHEATATAPINLSRLHDRQAAFATNAAIGVRAISAIADTRWPKVHPIIELLQKAYADIPPERL